MQRSRNDRFKPVEKGPGRRAGRLGLGLGVPRGDQGRSPFADLLWRRAWTIEFAAHADPGDAGLQPGFEIGRADATEADAPLGANV